MIVYFESNPIFLQVQSSRIRENHLRIVQLHAAKEARRLELASHFAYAWYCEIGGCRGRSDGERWR